MEETKQILTDTLIQFRSKGQFFGILLLGFVFFVFLYMEKRLHHPGKKIGLMSILGVLLLENPVSVFLHQRFVPDSSHFMQLLFVIPISLFIPFLMVTAIDLLENKKKQFLLIGGFSLVLILSGTFYLYNLDLKNEQQEYGISKEVMNVLDFLIQKEQAEFIDENAAHISLLAVDEIMEAARSYNSCFIMPYGKDIQEGSRTYYIHDYNSDEMQLLHNNMKKFEDYEVDIFQTAKNHQIEYVILRKTINEKSGTWYYPEEGGKILLTQEIIQEYSLAFQEEAIKIASEAGYGNVAYEGPYLIFRQFD